MYCEGLTNPPTKIIVMITIARKVTNLYQILFFCLVIFMILWHGSFIIQNSLITSESQWSITDIQHLFNFVALNFGLNI